MTDKQFNDAFTSTGGWFFLSQFQEIYHWQGDCSALIDKMFQKGFDKNRTGTNTRVSSVLRIIEENRSIEALEKCKNSSRINKDHEDASQLAIDILETMKAKV